jgi:hypothetical protein
MNKSREQIITYLTEKKNSLVVTIEKAIRVISEDADTKERLEQEIGRLVAELERVMKDLNSLYE